MIRIGNAFRKIFYGQGRPRGSLEPLLAMLLIGLVMGLLLQSLNLQNRNLRIRNLEKRIQFLELRLLLETQTTLHSERRKSDREKESRIREAGEGPVGVLVCELR